MIRIAYGVNKSSSDAGFDDEATVFRRPLRPAASDSYGVATALSPTHAPDTHAGLPTATIARSLI